MTTDETTKAAEARVAFRIDLPNAEVALGADEANNWRAMERRADTLALKVAGALKIEEARVSVECDNVNCYAYERNGARDWIRTYASGDCLDWIADGRARSAVPVFVVWNREDEDPRSLMEREEARGFAAHRFDLRISDSSGGRSVVQPLTDAGAEAVEPFNRERSRVQVRDLLFLYPDDVSAVLSDARDDALKVDDERSAS